MHITSDGLNLKEVFETISKDIGFNDFKYIYNEQEGVLELYVKWKYIGTIKSSINHKYMFLVSYDLSDRPPEKIEPKNYNFSEGFTPEELEARRVRLALL